MPWESEEDAVKPKRDWARIMWVVVALLMLAGAAMMFLPSRTTANITEARVRHILIKVEEATPAGAQAALDKATSLRERILKGESFTKLAAENSADESSAGRGGDLGWVHRNELTEAIDDYIWRGPVGEVSDVIPSTYGLHLVWIEERHFSDAEKYEEELKRRVLEEGGAAAPATP